MATIRDTISDVRERIQCAAERIGRSANEITLCAVSKHVPIDQIQAAYDAGVRVFGENYVQEAIRKFESLPKDLELHLTGPLQRNKAKQAIGFFSLIQTVDRVPLIERLNELASRESIRQDVLMQVNIAKDDAKSGVHPEAASDLFGRMLASSNLNVVGLMTIGSWAPGASTESNRRAEFAALRKLRDSLAQEYHVLLPVLSMGMSADYEWAIEEGATLVRVGTSIFGERINP